MTPAGLVPSTGASFCSGTVACVDERPKLSPVGRTDGWLFLERVPSSLSVCIGVGEHELEATGEEKVDDNDDDEAPATKDIWKEEPVESPVSKEGPGAEPAPEPLGRGGGGDD